MDGNTSQIIRHTPAYADGGAWKRGRAALNAHLFDQCFFEMMSSPDSLCPNSESWANSATSSDESSFSSARLSDMAQHETGYQQAPYVKTERASDRSEHTLSLFSLLTSSNIPCAAHCHKRQKVLPSHQPPAAAPHWNPDCLPAYNLCPNFARTSRELQEPRVNTLPNVPAQQPKQGMQQLQCNQQHDRDVKAQDILETDSQSDEMVLQRIAEKGNQSSKFTLAGEAAGARRYQFRCPDAACPIHAEPILTPWLKSTSNKFRCISKHCKAKKQRNSHTILAHVMRQHIYGVPHDL